MRYLASSIPLFLVACDPMVSGAPDVATHAWSVGELGACDAPGFCGSGVRSRPVSCVSDRGTVVSDSFCEGPRPVAAESCVATTGCVWQADSSGDCNAPTSCSAGSETRVITCRDFLGTEVDPAWCSGPKPDVVGGCLRRTGCVWEIGAFGSCDVGGCGEGFRSRPVDCLGLTGESVPDSWCPSPVPLREEACSDFSGCVLDVSAWSECTAGCGYGTRTRTVTCETPSGLPVSPSWCDATSPPTSESCVGTADCCPPQALTAAPFASGAGTADSPYVICTATQLDKVRTSLQAYYFLGRDIELDGIAFAPIGSSTQRFEGTFDGAFHTVSDWSYSAPAASYVGFFSQAGYGTIKQLRLENVNVEGDVSVGALCGRCAATISDVAVSGTVRGNRTVGGLAGDENWGSAARVQSAVVVSGDEFVGGIAGIVVYASLVDVESTGAITGTRYVGGLAGQIGFQASALNVSASGDVTGTDFVGGLVGASDGFAVVRASSTGTVSGASSVGGSVGYNTTGLFDAWSTGAVSGSSYVGGLVGRNDGLVGRAFSTGAVSGTTSNGGLVGGGNGIVRRGFWDVTSSTRASSAGGTGLTSAAMRSPATYVEWDTYVVWQLDEGALPSFRAQPRPCTRGATAFSGGSGTTANPFVIDEPSQLYDVSCNLDASFVLGAPLDFAGIAATPPIGILTTGRLREREPARFTGTFDGAGFSIANWSGYSARGGLFLDATGATLKNLTLDEVEVGGGVSVGGLAGNAYSVTLSRITVQGAVFGHYVTGGVTGEFSGTASRVFANVDVLGGGYTGGVIGFCNGGVYSDSYALGTVNMRPGSGFSSAGFAGGGNGSAGCTLTNTYAAVAMTGSNVAGLAYGVSATNSYWDTQVSGTSAVGIGSGKTTAELRTQSTFVGWDFGTVWRIEPGSYPTLR